MRIETVEPPRYLCWTWTPVARGAASRSPTSSCGPSGPSCRAPTAERTSTYSRAASRSRPDFDMNSGGWDGDVLPALRKHLGEG